MTSYPSVPTISCTRTGKDVNVHPPEYKLTDWQLMAFLRITTKVPFIKRVYENCSFCFNLVTLSKLSITHMHLNFLVA